jgi:hypothetical protein
MRNKYYMSIYLKLFPTFIFEALCSKERTTYMRYPLTIIALLFAARLSYAQNIVPNASFEENTGCPDAYSQISFCDGWATGNEGTPDYYNACDSSSVYGASFSVPNNCSGSQRAFAGAAYAGIYGYSEITTPDYHEYLMVKIPALAPGATYHVSVEISLADSSGYATDGLGMLFNTMGSYAGITTIPLAPQMSFYSSGVVSNTSSWTRLSGNFIADSAYTYALFGVFKNSGQLFKEQIKSAPLFLAFSYYYIDSVTIYKVTGAGVAAAPMAAKPLVYPNPLLTGSALLSFDNPGKERYHFFLYGPEGRTVKEITDISGNQVEIEKGCLPPGLYYYRLQGQNGTATVGKLAIGDQ